MNILAKIKSIIMNNSSAIATIVIGVIVLVTYFFVFLKKDENAPKRATEIYFADYISPGHQKIIDNFNRMNEGSIKVIPIDLPFTKFSTNERKELLTRSLRSKSERIDVFAVDVIWVHRFAKWCVSLDKFLSEEELDEFIPESINSCLYNNEMMAIPLYIDIGVMFYRYDLLKKIAGRDNLEDKLKNSITWEDFINLGRNSAGQYDSYYIFPAKDYEGLMCSYFEMILNQDRNFFNHDKIDFTAAPARKALKYLYDLVNTYKFTPEDALGFTENPVRDYFLNHKSVFFRGWPGINAHFDTVLKDSLERSNIRVSALPHFENTEPAFVYGGWNLMISKFSKHKNEVKKFIKYAISDEAQKILYDNDYCLPIKESLYIGEFVSKHPELEYFRELLKKGVNRPIMEDYTRISDIVAYYVNKCLANQISIDEALKKATELVNSNKVIIK